MTESVHDIAERHVRIAELERELEREVSRLNLKLDLYQLLHQKARGVLRYNGVDDKRFTEYWAEFKIAVNDINLANENEEES